MIYAIYNIHAFLNSASLVSKTSARLQQQLFLTLCLQVDLFNVKNMYSTFWRYKARSRSFSDSHSLRCSVSLMCHLSRASASWRWCRFGSVRCSAAHLVLPSSRRARRSDHDDRLSKSDCGSSQAAEVKALNWTRLKHLCCRHYEIRGIVTSVQIEQRWDKENNVKTFLTIFCFKMLIGW